MHWILTATVIVFVGLSLYLWNKETERPSVDHISIYWGTEQLTIAQKNQYKRLIPRLVRLINEYSNYPQGRMFVRRDPETGKNVYWDKGALYKAIRKAGGLRIWVVDGPSYDLPPYKEKVIGHTDGPSGVVISFRGPVWETALTHELIHFIDMTLYDRRDIQHLSWESRYSLIKTMNDVLSKKYGEPNNLISKRGD